MREARFSQEEFARRGEEIYDRDVLPRVTPGDQGRVVAIEIETGDYEIGRNEVVAGQRLRARHPDALFWFRRVGSPYLHRFGHHHSAASVARR